MRRIFFLTAARSEYDLMYPVIREAANVPGLQAEVIAAAAHLSPFHGMGINQIRGDGVAIAGTIETLLSSESWEGRALSFAQLIEGLTRLLSHNRPDVLFVSGDREEALAGALVANFLGIHVAHSHGGDRAIVAELDEMIRPAISKFAHLHFPATEGHRERLIRMGEPPERIWTVGGAGLDVLRQEPDVDDETLIRDYGVDVRKPFFMVIHHSSPLLGAEHSGEDVRQVLEGVLALGYPVFCSYPNFDPGNIAIRKVINEIKARSSNLTVYHNLPRDRFAALYRRCSAIVGNSSSIVIESAFLKVAGVLVGPRQDLRDRGPNVQRVEISAEAVREACRRALEDEEYRDVVRNCPSLYGDGHSSERIVKILAEIPLTREMLLKTMAY